MTSKLQLIADDYLPLRDVVFKTLRGAILRGELKPGERLMEIRLANELGVSRTPIREAIRMLELEGLVLMVPRRGAQVAKITEKDLKEVLEGRIGLDELAIGFACERVTPEQLEAIREAGEYFESLADSEDLTAVAEADVRFHDRIYDAAGNQRLNQILSNLREQMYRYRMEYLKDTKQRRKLAAEHRAMYEAIRLRDTETAKREIRSHVQQQEEAIILRMREEG